MNIAITTIGRLACYSVLLMATLTTIIVIARYGFNWSSIALQESVLYLHAFLFLLAIPWALQTDHHVRVDVFYRQQSQYYKAWVNSLGNLFLLLPYAIFVSYQSWDFADKSWEILEESPNSGGLPFVFALKTLIPISFVLLTAQATILCISDIKLLVTRHE